MAGIPWGKYDRADWERVPGGARRYRLKQRHDITISRRQYDEHYGSAVQYGTYERKAKSQAGPKQLLKPARGRTSALKLTPAEQEAEANRRKVAKQEAKTEKLANKELGRKTKPLKSINLKNFHKGHRWRKFRTGVSREEIEHIRALGQKSCIIFGYLVGLVIISDRDGQIKTPICFDKTEDIRTEFSDELYQKCLDRFINYTQYAQLVGMFIGLVLNKKASIKNGVKFKNQ